jgi:hypothetical protein
VISENVKALVSYRLEQAETFATAKTFPFHGIFTRPSSFPNRTGFQCLRQCDPTPIPGSFAGLMPGTESPNRDAKVSCSGFIDSPLALCELRVRADLFP